MIICCSVAQLCPTLCDPMNCMQHTRLPCPSPSPGACSNSCPLSQWYHPTVSSSVILFPLPLTFPASGSFPMSRLFASGGQSTGASASVFLMNIQDWFLLGLTGLTSLCCPRHSEESSPASQYKSSNASVLSLLYGSTLTSILDYWKKP